MDTTASLASGVEVSDEPARGSCLVLALQAATHAGVLRVSLAGLDALTIGRGARTAVTRAGKSARLEVDDRFHSREQFHLYRAGAAWELVDAGSKNGTRLHGARAARALLADGDVLEAGTSFFVLRMVPGSDAQLAPGDGSVLRTVHAPLAAALAGLEALAPSTLPILIRGESGAGKEVAARTIHALSRRRGPLVAVNCGALTASLAEPELFGARRGAYSGATEDRPGLIRTAEHGTLFLDEIADLPLPAQAALLRFVQEGEVRAVGAHHTARIDARVIAATHRDLDAMIARGEFRHDLAARLGGHVLRVPPLRERREDLGLLIAELLARIAPGPPATLTPRAARALFAHGWPANVRELEHALRAAVARGGRTVRLEDLPATVLPSPPPSAPAEPAVLAALLAQHRGNISAVARALATSRTHVRRLMDRHGVK